MSGRVLIRNGDAAYDCGIAETFCEHMAGLMFSGKKNILFVLGDERTFGIHSFFVFFPFDAVYLDGRKRVVDVIRNIAPFTPYVKNRKPAAYLLELTEKNRIRVGDKLEW